MVSFILNHSYEPPNYCNRPLYAGTSADESFEYNQKKQKLANGSDERRAKFEVGFDSKNTETAIARFVKGITSDVDGNVMEGFGIVFVKALLGRGACMNQRVEKLRWDDRPQRVVAVLVGRYHHPVWEALRIWTCFGCRIDADGAEM
eukprot:CAMPEP_0178515024 /NCGR_PEP_ID=MMETSP0696-20121128/24332_1 /TAXON_ID=265572 /ORGANISM="Extubocellulus spinifer, Strain CCMP396" /LENGTH=146 /DNA_ID=CAMNT_0020145151 /DNA_START=59 /DNA_END=497 /DNA_ORIENTATION=-